MCEEKKRRKWILAVGTLGLLFSLGVGIDEADFLGGDHTSTQQYLEVYSAFLLLLVYIVPFCIWMRSICRNYKLRETELLAAAVCGAFIPAAFAGVLNDAIGGFLSKQLGSFYSDQWLGSLEVGVVEELLKLGTTALILYVLGRRRMKDYLSIGMCVGIGFQIEEDLSYITDSGFKDVNQAFPAALDRIAGAVGSHWAYAAVTAAGLYLIVRTGEKGHTRKGIGLIILVIADHFLYDSPIGDSVFAEALLAVAVVLPVILFFKRPEMRIEEVK